jgi:hypothetical protein
LLPRHCSIQGPATQLISLGGTLLAKAGCRGSGRAGDADQGVVAGEVDALAGVGVAELALAATHDLHRVEQGRPALSHPFPDAP